jgi:hypothetical protein
MRQGLSFVHDEGGDVFLGFDREVGVLDQGGSLRTVAFEDVEHIKTLLRMADGSWLMRTGQYAQHQLVRLVGTERLETLQAG